MNLSLIGIADSWENALNTVFDKYDISTPLRKAAFIGQCAHESSNFRVLQENLNYSAQALAQLFPSRFPTMDMAIAYNRNPEKIANKLYNGRMGNTEDGDGWAFRGRGLIQITGRDMYSTVGDAMGLDLISNPDLLLDPDNAAMSAGWFWNKKGLNALADAKNYEEMTKRINGGLNGLADRITRINNALVVV